MGRPFYLRGTGQWGILLRVGEAGQRRYATGILEAQTCRNVGSHEVYRSLSA